MAASGLVPIQDNPHWPCSPSGLSRAWSQDRKKLGGSPRVFSSTGTLYPFTINDDQTEIHFTLNQNQDPLLDKNQDP
jgi:hypothetical protein